MTSKPQLRTGSNLLPGLVAVALFAVLAAVFVNASFPGDPGFPSGGASITASIGYALFNIDAANAIPSEGFLVAFEIIDVVLVAALAAAVMLARREVDGAVTTALRLGGEDDQSRRPAPEEGEH